MQGSEKLAKRARRKYLNVPLMGHLLALESPLHKRYLTTIKCSGAIKAKDGKILSRYCKRPWCNVCQPIRTAIRINNYRNELELLPNLHLTTLTIPNCAAEDIKPSIRRFRAVFRQYRNTYKKMSGSKFRGVYNFEVTYNHKTGLYHPHIHIIHEGLRVDKHYTEYEGIMYSSMMNSLMLYWLAKNPQCSPAAQDTRPCTDLIEGFKYQALSIFKIKINGKKQPFVPVAELDKIYQSLSGVQCFHAFGIDKKVITDDEENDQMDNLTAYETDKPEGVYVWKDHDWFNTLPFDPETGEVIPEGFNLALSDFVPNEKTRLLHDKLSKNEHYHRTIPVPV